MIDSYLCLRSYGRSALVVLMAFGVSVVCRATIAGVHMPAESAARAVAVADSTVERALPLKALDVRPQFPGGREALIDYVFGRLAKDGVEGVPTKFFDVRVGFFIEKDGSITGARVLNGGLPEVNSAVTAMLEDMPRWSPGMKGGTPVRTRYATYIRVPDYSSGLEVKPEFPGGRDFLTDYLKGEVNTKGLVEEGDDPVRVVVEFTVKADGSISGAGILRHGSEGMDAEALRVIAAMPRWKPGTIDGVPADIKVKVPVTFSSATSGGDNYVSPEFPGGKELWHEYVRRNLEYPEYSSIAGRSGQVVVRFTVDKDGRITNPNVVKHAAADMDSAAVRLISGLPRINPAMRDGRPVRVRTSWTINFKSGETADTRLDMDRLMNRDKWWENGGRRRDGRSVKAKRSPRVVYVVDGQEVEAHVVDHLDAKTIKTFKTLSPQEARDRFGAKAADGAIVITTTGR